MFLLIGTVWIVEPIYEVDEVLQFGMNVYRQFDDS